MEFAESYTINQLESMTGEELGEAYINMYIDHHYLGNKIPNLDKELKKIAEILRKKDFDERFITYEKIRKGISIVLDKEEYEKAKILDKLRDFYYKNILM